MNYSASLDQCAEVLAGDIHPKEVVWTKLFAAVCQGEFDSKMVLQNRFHEREEPFTGAKLIEAFRACGDVPPTGTTDQGKGELPVAEMVAVYRPYYSRDMRNMIGRIRIDMQVAQAWWEDRPPSAQRRDAGPPAHATEAATKAMLHLFDGGIPPAKMTDYDLTESVNKEISKSGGTPDGKTSVSMGTVTSVRRKLRATTNNS